MYVLPVINSSFRFNCTQKIISKNETLYDLNLNLNSNAMLNKSYISFGMKKKEFKGIDFLMVEKLKAPVEKFKVNDDFQKYCQKILKEKYLGNENIEKISQSEYPGKTANRKKVLTEWINYIVNENCFYTPSVQLMILSSITKDVNKKGGFLPNLDKNVLAETLTKIKKSVETKKGIRISFNKQYKFNLEKNLLEENTQINDELTGWVKIPSKNKDPENFEENVKRLKTLSHQSWCTGTYSSIPYLTQGDFHIYLEKGEAKVGISFKNGEISEIQGKKNNGEIPFRYFDIITSHIEEDRCKLSKNIKQELNEVLQLKQKINALKERFLKYKKNDYENILSELGIEVEKDSNDNMLILSHYSNPYQELFFSDLGIDENDLFKHVKEIKGNADFSNCELSNLGNLTLIDGNVDFGHSRITNLSNLQKIGGNAVFSYSKITNTGKLEEIGGDVNFQNSKIANLGNLKRINQNIYFNKEITSLDKLEEIGGNVNFKESEVFDLGNLKRIGKNVWFSEKIANLGKLEEVGGDITFLCSKITSLGNLKKIGGDADFECSNVSDLGQLEEIGGDVYITYSQLQENDFKNVITKPDAFV